MIQACVLRVYAIGELREHAKVCLHVLDSRLCAVSAVGWGVSNQDQEPGWRLPAQACSSIQATQHIFWDVSPPLR